MPSSVGVYSKRNGAYPAKIIVEGIQIRLGDWPTEKQAAAAYHSAACHYRGEDAGRNGTGAPPRSQEGLQRRASKARAERRGDTSAYRGVVNDPDRPGWTAQIGIDGWSYFLGRFAEETHAARAADMAIRQYRPASPTNFEGEETRTVAEIRRWARRLKCEERLEGKSTASRYRGVWWDQRQEKWVAEIKVDREKTHLGCFDSEVKAAQAYDEAALRRHDPANTNFPPCDYDTTDPSNLP